MLPRPSHQQDLYARLGVQANATPAEIKKAYLSLARTWHPDLNKERHAEEEFKTVSEAYITLSNPIKRLQYNNERARYQPGHHNHTDPHGHHGQHHNNHTTAQEPTQSTGHHVQFRYSGYKMHDPTSLENLLRLFEELSKEKPNEQFIKEYTLSAGAHIFGKFLEGIFSANKK